MPKLIMKNFINNYKCLYYYDFEKNVIKRGFPRTLYAKEDYYTLEAEHYLDNEIETRLGKLVKALKETDYDKEYIKMVINEEVAFAYLYSLLARSPKFKDDVKSKTRIAQFLEAPEQYERSFALIGGIEGAKHNRILQSNYRVTVLYNRSKEEFVLPTGGVTQIGYRLVCPVTPWIALVFDKLDSSSIYPLYEVDDIDQVQVINIKAMIQEKNRDCKYVISRSRELLEKLIKDCGLF